MAQQISLQPPPPFDFKSPDSWSRWLRRFEQFRVASGLADESTKKQISTLLYCLGEESESVLASVNATEDDRKDYDKVLELFDGYFNVRRNVIFERARFNRCYQRPGESAEQYIMELYNLAANCNYGEMEQEMIRDRLVVGIRDRNLSKTLQLDPKLTLEREGQTDHSATRVCAGATVYSKRQRHTKSEPKRRLRTIPRSATLER